MSDSLFFFFNDTATTEIYTLSLHDALPILVALVVQVPVRFTSEIASPLSGLIATLHQYCRSEEHTSELQSQSNLVCRLLLEKKKYLASEATRSQHIYSLEACTSVLSWSAAA